MTVESTIDRAAEQARAVESARECICRMLSEARASQADLARSMGVSSAYISNVLNRKGNVSIRQFAAIAAALGFRVHFQYEEITHTATDQPMIKRFSPGERVEWQSAGWAPLHRGEVVAYVARGQNARNLAPEAFEGSRTYRKFDYDVSEVDRYVVRVDRLGAKGKGLPPHYYSPRASQVRPVSENT